jgi:hypothetical protein
MPRVSRSEKIFRDIVEALAAGNPGNFGSSAETGLPGHARVPS